LQQSQQHERYSADGSAGQKADQRRGGAQDVSPEAAVGGGLALLVSGGKIRIDLKSRKVDLMIPDAELAQRRALWRPPVLKNMKPWEEIYRIMVGQQGSGACLEPATLYLNIIETKGESRHSH